MTVPANSRRRQHQGNAVTTAFPGPMAYAADEVSAYLYKGVISTVVDRSKYRVTGLGRQNGTTVTFNEAPAADETVLLIRVVPFDQRVDITNQGAFLPEVVEKGYDNLAFQTQQLADNVRFSVRLPDNFLGDAPDLELPYPESGKPIGWNYEADGFRNIDIDGPADLLLRSDLSDPGGGGSLVAFRSAGTGAVARSVSARMADTVHAADFGVLANGSDETLKLQRAINYAMARGANLALPAGIIRVASPGVVLDSSSASAYGIPRASVYGDTALGTRIIGDPGNYQVFSVVGGAPATAGVNGLQVLKDFTVEKQDNSGVCINLQRCGVFRMENVSTRGGFVGLRMYDVLSSVFDQCHFGFAIYGVTAERQQFSDPNALTFIGCTIGGNVEGGANFVAGSNINFFGGSFEGNGIGGASATRYHLNITNAGNEGGCGLNVQGTYFENGSGLADILISNSSRKASYTITGATFNRTSNTNIMTNCIRIDCAAASTLVVQGCGFKSFNAYTPSASRPYIAVAAASQPVKVFELGNLYAEPLEKPDIPGPHVNSRAVATAWVRYNGATGAIDDSFNVAAVTKLTTGRCRVDFKRPMSTAVPVVVANFIAGAGCAYMFTGDANSVTIDTVSLGGSSVDAVVNLAVFGGGEIAG